MAGVTASDAAATSDFYDLIVERHRRASTVITSNRDPFQIDEWLALLGDQLLAQSAIDRFSSAAFELVIDGDAPAPVPSPTFPAPWVCPCSLRPASPR
jgi:hypothetical protein